jgi:hypothetical protein
MAQSAAALPANLDLYLHVRVLIGLSVTRLVSGIAALVQAVPSGRERVEPRIMPTLSGIAAVALAVCAA